MATVVAFHAHPDDEVLLTGGTLARLAAEGHRVVIAVATDGIMGPATGPGIWSGTRDRLAELRASAAQLGAARVVHLGYADSGYGHRDHVRVHEVGARGARRAVQRPGLGGDAAPRTRGAVPDPAADAAGGGPLRRGGHPVPWPAQRSTAARGGTPRRPRLEV